MELDDVADELYGVGPADFVRLRNARAKQARAEGRADLAAEITALRKPTRVGWLLNLVARTEPDDVSAILELSSALHDAQRSGRADRLRDLSADRGRVVAQVREAALRTAAAHELTLSPNTIREIDHTVRAAISDPDVAEQLRSGRMFGAVEYSGFGPPTLFAVDEPLATHASAPQSTGVDTEPLTPPDADEENRRLLTEAEERMAAARRDADDALDRLGDADRRLAELRTRRDDLRRELADVENNVRFAERQLEAARSDHDSATRTAERASRALDEIRARVDHT